MSHHLFWEHPSRPVLCSQATISRIKPSDSTVVPKACQSVSHNRRKTNTALVQNADFIQAIIAAAHMCVNNPMRICYTSTQMAKNGARASRNPFPSLEKSNKRRRERIARDRKKRALLQYPDMPKSPCTRFDWRLDNISGRYGHPVNVGILRANAIV